MLIGEVSGTRQAILDLTVLGASQRSVSVRAVIDTGFTEYLTLPNSVVDQLGLRWKRQTMITLADGRTRWVGVFAAKVRWFRDERAILAYGVEGTILAGMSLLYGYHLGIDVIDGGRLTIEALS